MKPGSRFPAGATRPAGHIFSIPACERPTDEHKTRPYFLVNRCDVAADPLELATLAHMTTKATEHLHFGSDFHEITSSTSKQPGRDGQFVIATRLLPRDPRLLTASAMSAVDEVRSVRTAVLAALGLGEGMAAPGTPSVRGRLVRVRDERAGIRHGFVLTSHAYSAKRRYQIIVPIIDRMVGGVGGPELLEITRWDVQPGPRPWWKALPVIHPLVDTAGLVSLSERWQQGHDPRRWLTRQIDVLEPSIDPHTLAAVEERIRARLHP